MKIKNKLLNPFALVGQGFLAGALLFYSTAPDAPTSPLPTSAQAVAAQQIAGI